MFIIDENTSRQDLLTAIYSEGSLIDALIAADLDPEFMDTEAVREFVMNWIEAGDECAA
jgi:hypothetical protein